MEESIDAAAASTPIIATVDEIQRRLLRPPSLQSQPPTSLSTPRDAVLRRDPSQFNVNRKLEDYLDPGLLAAVRAKIGLKRKREKEMAELNKEIRDGFEWPADRLKVFVEAPGAEKREEGAVDLDSDADSVGGRGGEEGKEGDVCCTPFRRFERTALKQFKA